MTAARPAQDGLCVATVGIERGGIDFGGSEAHYGAIPLQSCAGTMPLNFPNQSRSFYATRRAVRFWGYDSALEMSFFVSEGALKKLQPDMLLDEPGMLRAFDAHRDMICAAAAKVYVRGRKGSYDLERSDF